MNVWDRPLAVNKTDRYSITENDRWLDGEPIVAASVSSVDSPNNIILGEATITGDNTVSVLVIGLVEGYHTVHFDYSTSTRSSCYSAVVHVDGDC